MSRLLLALLAGLAVGGGGTFVALRAAGGCLDRCGEGTVCVAGRCLPVPPPPSLAAPAAPEKKKRRRSSTQAGAAAGDPLAAPELTLAPGDEAVQSQGDALGRPEVIDFNAAGGSDDKLSDEAIERVFAAVRPAVSGCVGRAVGEYPLERAHVEVGARIEASGRVDKVRVTAPALLLRQGLARCVRPLVTGLRFPASGGASVVTWPFDLQ